MWHGFLIMAIIIVLFIIIYCKLRLASCIPKSTIVYDERDDFKTKGYKLYKKYIQVGSEWEINVNSSLRKALQQKFDNDMTIKWDNNTLYTLFDRCNDEMLKLLGYSISRFKHKPEFTRLQSLRI